MFRRNPEVTAEGTVLVHVYTLGQTKSSAHILWDTRMYCRELTTLLLRVPTYIVPKGYVLL
jgi:hypothetical protein